MSDPLPPTPSPPLSCSSESIVEAVVGQAGEKKKDKKRKRVESAQSGAGGEPPQKHIAPPTAPRNCTIHHSLPPTPHPPPLPERDLSRSPHTPISPTAIILPLDPPKHPKKTYSKVHRTPSYRQSHSSPGIPNGPRCHATGLPSPPTPQSAKSKPTASGPTHNVNANKDRTIRELRQKLTKREADITRLTKRLAAVEGQRIQQASLAQPIAPTATTGSTSTAAAGTKAERVAKAAAEYYEKLEKQMGGVREENIVLEQSLGSMKEEGRSQSVKLVEAEARSRALAQQVRTAVERGKKWVKRSEELEAQLGEKGKEVEIHRTRAVEAEEQLRLLLTDTTLGGGPLRQTLLSAKSSLAQERNANSGLRSQLAAATTELASRAETIVTRDQTIVTRDQTIVARDKTVKALTTSVVQLEADLADSRARVVELDKECEGQLGEMKNLIETTSTLGRHTEALVREQEIRQQLCNDHYARITRLEASLAGADERAEWYKAEHERTEGDAVWWRKEADRLRKVADAAQKRAVKFDRNRLGRVVPAGPTYPVVGAWRGHAAARRASEGCHPSGQAGVKVGESSAGLLFGGEGAELSFAEKLEIAQRAAATLAAGLVKEEKKEEGEDALLPSE